LPTDLDCLEKLGHLKIRHGRYGQAVQHLQEANIYKPNDITLLINLATAYAKNDEMAKAKKIFATVLDLDPDNQAAKIMLAALNNTTPNKCPTKFVRDLFDSYADRYELELLTYLKYKTHQILYTLIKQHYKKDHIITGLDLGCGTGLLGRLLQNKFKGISLTGIDLSTQMLAKANATECYNKLLNGDLTAVLAAQIDSSSYKDDFMFDMVTAADVFVYIGDLDEIFAKVKKVLYAGGVFCFSVEHLLQGKIKFSINARFSHSEKYLLTLCEKHGFTWKTNLVTEGRQENTIPVLMNHVLLIV
jgi:predicted TPR repeat methyltransferase